MGRFRILRLFVTASPQPRQVAPPLTPQLPREMRVVVAHPSRPPPPDAILSGPCWVVDGDTIIIDNVRIRLAGIDAPELDHPWGQQAKWTLVKLCKGQIVTARLKPELSYDRVVAECFLPDGRDLAGEMVRVGLALDWPKFSGGKYRHLEPEDARRKLWRAQLRQRGLFHPQNGDIETPARQTPTMPSRRVRQPFQAPTPVRALVRQAGHGRGGLVLPGLLVLATVCILVLVVGNTDSGLSPPPRQSRQVLASFVVTAEALNVRQAPTASSGIIGQISQGTTVTPQHISGLWYSVVLSDGSAGWVHGDYLRPVSN